MSTLELVADMRERTGKKVKALRRDGLVPAHIVSRGKESRNIQIAALSLDKALAAVGFTQPVELIVDKDRVTVLVTDVAFKPAKNTVEHVTFQEVKKGELVTADVPLEMVGDAPGVTQGLILVQLEDSVEIETGALSIPERYELDVSILVEEGDTIRAKDIPMTGMAKLQSDPESALARLEAPRAVEEEPEAEETEEVTDAEDGGESSDEQNA